MASGRIVLFGATGYTGRLTAEAMVARGERPVLAGRNPALLTELAAELGGLEAVTADVHRPESVRALLGPGDVLVTTVGPFTRWGDVYLEMIEPVVGHGNAREWLEMRGEGIFHLGYAVDDLSQRPDGVECVFESWGARMPNGDPAVIHLDTVEQLGYYVELSDRALVNRLNATIDQFMAQQMV